MTTAPKIAYFQCPERNLLLPEQQHILDDIFRFNISNQGTMRRSLIGKLFSLATYFHQQNLALVSTTTECQVLMHHFKTLKEMFDNTTEQLASSCIIQPEEFSPENLALHSFLRKKF